MDVFHGGCYYFPSPRYPIPCCHSGLSSLESKQTLYSQIRFELLCNNHHPIWTNKCQLSLWPVEGSYHGTDQSVMGAIPSHPHLNMHILMQNRRLLGSICIRPRMNRQMIANWDVVALHAHLVSSSTIHRLFEPYINKLRKRVWIGRSSHTRTRSFSSCSSSVDPSKFAAIYKLAATSENNRLQVYLISCWQTWVYWCPSPWHRLNTTTIEVLGLMKGNHVDVRCPRN